MKLDVEDLQFEKMVPFDGSMAYAQNKRQQVVMTDQWAEKYKKTGIHFSSMHPGQGPCLPQVLQSWGKQYWCQNNGP